MPLLLSVTLFAGCLGGVGCPTEGYDPVGEVLPDRAESDACAEENGQCVFFCATVCTSGGDYVCEPCGRVRDWAAENCPECLEEHSYEDAGLDLSLGCTND